MELFSLYTRIIDWIPFPKISNCTKKERFASLAVCPQLFNKRREGGITRDEQIETKKLSLHVLLVMGNENK